MLKYLLSQLFNKNENQYCYNIFLEKCSNQSPESDDIKWFLHKL